MLESYEKQTFKDKNFTKENLKKVEFFDCKFINCNFSETELRSTAFLECGFKNCDLSLVNVVDTRFRNVKFDKCKLIGINFCQVSELSFTANFTNCLLNYCFFSEMDLKKFNFTDSTIKESDFRGANLEKASFANSDLERTVFAKTNLKSADFVGAKNYTIDPRDNNLSKVKFSFPEVIRILETIGIEIEQ